MEHCFIYAPDRAIAETKSGKVRGYEYDGISIFKGIPYAKARRFHAPEPVERWDVGFIVLSSSLNLECTST